MAKLDQRKRLALRRRRLRGAPNKIRLALELAGERQTELAAGTGIAPSNLSAIINGKYSAISLETCRRLAVYFGLRIEDLFPPGEASGQVIPPAAIVSDPAA